MMKTRIKLPFFAVLTVVGLVGLSSPAYAADVNSLLNGDFEGTFTSGVAASWTTANSGTGVTWSQDTVNFRGAKAQKIARTTSNAANWVGVRQVVSADVGDAFTLADAWVFCPQNSTKTEASVRVHWDGTTTAIGTATALATAAQGANTWYHFTSLPAGNATSTSVNFGFVTKLAAGNAASTAIDGTWDDLVIYHAYVPLSPTVNNATPTTLDVTVNKNTSDAEVHENEYAITVSGGGYVEGTSWVQSGGTVGATKAWRTRAVWDLNKTVIGLAANTLYTFKVVSRYSSSFPQQTVLANSAGGSGTTLAAAGATRLVITGSGTQTAGSSQDLTITAKDDGGNTISSYTGSKNLTFSGANSSPNATAPTVKNSSGTAIAFGSTTAITFSSGVATVSGGNNGAMTLYKAESATISVFDGTILSSGADRLSVTVNPAAVGAAESTVDATPTSIPADGTTASTITVTLLDGYNNPISGKTVTLSSSRGATDTISAASGPSSSSGVVTFTVTSTTPGSPVFTAVGDSVSITETATVTFTPLPKILHWGANDGNWTDSDVWVDSVTELSATYNDSVQDSVVLADAHSGSGDRTITLNTTVTPGAVSMTADSKNFEITTTSSGAIAGSIGLTKGGTGTLTLGTPNTYSGDTRILNGTLELDNIDALAGSTLETATTGTDSGTLSFGSLSGAVNVGNLSGSRNLAVPSGVTLSIGSNNLTKTYTGTISGSGGFRKSGTGTFTWGNGTVGPMTYTGDTTLDQGLTIISKTDFIPSSGNLTVNGILVIQGANDINSHFGSLSGSGFITNSPYSGTAPGPTITVGANNATTTFSGKILKFPTPASQHNSFVKVGTGTLTMSGGSELGGAAGCGVFINAGKIRAATTSSAVGGWGVTVNDPTGTGSAALEIVNIALNGFQGGGLTLGTNSIMIGSGAASHMRHTGGNPSPTASSPTILNYAQVILSTLISGDTLTLGSVVSGGNANSLITVNGPGTIKLDSGSSSGYAGGWALSSGTLVLANANSLGSSGRPITLNGGTLALTNNTATTFVGNVTVGGNAAIAPDRAGAGAGITHSLGTLSIGNSTLTVQGGTVADSGTMALTLGAVTLTGAPTFDVNNAAGAVTRLNLGAIDNGANLITVQGSGDIRFTGIVGSGAGGLSKSGTGSLTLSANNSYTGTTTVSAGVISVASGALLSGATAPLVVDGGTLNLNNAAQTVGSLSGSGGAVNLASGHVLTVNQSGNTTYAGALASSGGLTKSGAGNLTLTGANGYSGTTTISGGTLTADVANTLSSSSAINVSGGTLDIQGNNQSVGAVTLSSGTIAGSGGALNGTSFGVESGSVSAILAGSGVGLTKTTSGTVTLSGANSYSGSSALNAGTLILNGSVAGSASVAAAATLKGTGTISGAATISGILSPGNSIGQLNTGDEIWNGGGEYQWEVSNVTGAAGIDWDHLNITGGINLQATPSSKFTVKIQPSPSISGFNNDSAYEWTIATLSGANSVTNFDASAFNLDTSSVTEDLAGGQFLMQQGSLKLLFTNNHPPVASSTNVVRAKGTAFKIKIADLIAGSTSDPDGHGRALLNVGVDTAPTKGTLSTSSTYIFYTPNDPDNMDADSFSYRVKDLAPYRVGDTVRSAFANINLTVANSVGNLSITNNGGTNMILTFYGIPGYTYRLQRSCGDLESFADLGDPITAPTNGSSFGLVQTNDTPGACNPAYYRVRQN